jgi:hypothetical protein
VHDSECQAGQDTLAADEDCARATGALITTLFGTGEMNTLAQQIEQRQPKIELKLSRFAVNVQSNLRHFRSSLGLAVGNILGFTSHLTDHRHVKPNSLISIAFDGPDLIGETAAATG